MREDLLDHRLFEDRGDELQRAAAVGAVLPVEIEHALEPLGPAQPHRAVVPTARLAIGGGCGLRGRCGRFRRAGQAGSGQPWRIGVGGCRGQILDLPCTIGDYTDFYTGIHHATAVGKLFRPDNPLLPNYKWGPIGYHGRVSSLVVSGTPLHRPLGQTKAPTADAPSFGPCQRLDCKLELAALVGPGNALGQPVPMANGQWPRPRTGCLG